MSESTNPTPDNQKPTYFYRLTADGEKPSNAAELGKDYGALGDCSVVMVYVTCYGNLGPCFVVEEHLTKAIRKTITTTRAGLLRLLADLPGCVSPTFHGAIELRDGPESDDLKALALALLQLQAHPHRFGLLVDHRHLAALAAGKLPISRAAQMALDVGGGAKTMDTTKTVYGEESQKRHVSFSATLPMGAYVLPAEIVSSMKHYLGNDCPASKAISTVTLDSLSWDDVRYELKDE